MQQKFQNRESIRMSEHLWLGEIKIRPKQRERKIKEEIVRCTQYLLPSSTQLRS